MKSYKVAVIGAGDMGSNHAAAWKLAGHEVISITDIDEPRAQSIANQYELEKVYTDYKQAAADPEAEIISICLPLPFHAPVTIYAAQQGKHVFCEKPLANSFQDAAAMEEAVRKAGVQFGIGFQRNLSNSLKQVKQWADEGKFGTPMVINSTNMMEVRPKRIMHDANGNNGPIMDTGCHYFLMWQTIFGSKPKSIYARGGILAKDRAELSHIQSLAIDTGIITVEYESGDIAEMTVSWGLPAGFKMGGRTDRIFGPKGGAEGSFNNVTDRLMLYEGGEKEEVPVDRNQNLHQDQFALFAEAIEKGEPAPVSFQAGKEMLAVTLAILESIETEKVVSYVHP
ncbi:Gfo/Idh/MocA family protein [Paenibacillus nasutitermitis]|uniref:Oxidoreductase YrbE n=1 Tax=Paenibacillus nasutitermitis TaxID=1652958 RepID=A0A917DRF5_9BACL|nr:Gfo/Idh/MocA family oxidoreductase [Paenibacillus nasutitermitis]GGD61610.1 putative oxidoreductase YrbE [Paenibacillus nasutitermitis]